MALGILKKDLILLWPVMILSALAEFALDGMAYAVDADPTSQSVKAAAQLLVAVTFLAIVFTVALGVQQEPIPGTRQDWLTRPIRRTDLVLAKLLFVLVAVHLPLLIADLAATLAHGFSIGEAIAAAARRNLDLFVVWTLPALAFAAMTRSVSQFVGAGVAYFIGTVAVTLILSLTARLGGQEQATNPLAWTGVGWIPQILGRLVLAAGAIVALQLLYSKRRVWLARGVFPVFAVLSVLTVLLPWSWVFATQEAVAAPAAADLALAFDPSAPRYQPAPGEDIDAYGVGSAQVQLRGRAAGDITVENKARGAQKDVTVLLPLDVAGLPAGAMPWSDRAEVRLTTADGKPVFQGRGDALKPDRAKAGRVYEAIRVPGLVYQANKDQPLTLRIDYSLSLLRADAPISAPALGSALALPGLGRCSSGRDEDGDEIALRCVKIGRAPSCVSARLEDPASGRRNPDVLICAPDYAPFDLKPIPDALTRFEVEAPFRDRLGVAIYPVGSADLGSARIVVTRYRAAAHGQRQVNAEGVRLSAWTAASG